MATTTVTPQTAAAAGIDLSFQALNATDTFEISNGGELFLYIEETGATANNNVTIDTPKTIGGLSVTNQVIDVDANEQKVAGPFPRHLYGDTLSVTCDSANVKIAAVALR